MTSVYNFRKIRKSTISSGSSEIHAKYSFKTEDASWVDTPYPFILPISLHTRFHHGFEGFLKMECLISTLKSYTKGKATVYLAENGHLNTLSLLHKDPYKKCKNVAQELVSRFKSVFSGLDIKYSDFVLEDPNYHHYKAYFSDMYAKDSIFRSQVDQEAHASLTQEREALFVDEESYVKNSVLDILNRLATLLVFESNGYQFLFYPGPTPESNMIALQGKKLRQIPVKIHNHHGPKTRKNIQEMSDNSNCVSIDYAF